MSQVYCDGTAALLRFVISSILTVHLNKNVIIITLLLYHLLVVQHGTTQLPLPHRTENMEYTYHLITVYTVLYQYALGHRLHIKNL